MRILGFVEGAVANKGGVGLFGVPGILCGTAARGHHVALVVGGLQFWAASTFPLPT